MLHTTFNLLKTAGACGQRPGSGEGYDKLATHLGGVTKYGKNTPIPLITILDSNGLADTLWCLRAVLPDEEANRDRNARLLACDFVERVLPLFEAKYPNDLRPRQAIAVARRFAFGAATVEELRAAEAAAAEAAWAAAAAAAAAAAERQWQTERLRAMLEEEKPYA